jgi:peptidoglycan/xylan/chitin deacetylase (PgdA/CDA1 family)
MMRRRAFLTGAGITAVGAAAYGASRRDSSETSTNGTTETDESESDAENGGNGENGEEESDEDDSFIEDSNGMLVFTYDDSPVEDYTLTYEVHQEYDVPGCIAACPGLMEDSDAFLEPDQLREMHEDGWGVMSHTYHHRSLGRIRLTETAREGDDRIYVESNRHGDFPDDPLVVFDEQRTASTTVADAGSDSTGQYVELEEPLSETIDAGGYMRHPEEFIQEILDDTDDQLEAWGLDVTGFVYTYDRYHGVVEDVVRDHHEAVANHRYGGGHNLLEGLDPTTMQRMYIETDKSDEADIDEFMETAAADDVVSIVGAHSNFETFTEERLRYTIEAALENDLAVVTIDDVLDELDVR